MTSTKDPVRIAAAGQAAEWLIANQAATLDHSHRAAFFAWLRSSPIHIEEYFGVALVARDLRLAADDTGEALESLLELARADAAGRVVPVRPPIARELPERRYAVPRRWLIAAAATLAAVSVAWWMTAETPGSGFKTYSTRHGEQSRQRLADGSTVHLDTESAVEVKYDGDNRLARLEAGQALFTVAHGDSRRFRVLARDVEIVAVGTRFNVRLNPAATLVTVVEGKVDVRMQAPVGAAAADTRRVSAGYQLKIDGGGLPAQSEPVDTEAAIAWLQHQIAFESQPLGEVADEFNRYGTVQFVIQDTGLRALRVSGVFNAYDTNSFAAFLASLEGVRLERTAREIRVLRQDAGQPQETPPAN
jgi:transmembrane sensor